MKRLAIAVVAFAPLFAAARSYEWSWRMPDRVYQNLEFTLRSAVDRAAKVYDQADSAERRGTKVTDLVPQYRAAKAEWKKVQIQAEAEGFDESLLAYVIFMQGLSAVKAHDRNEGLKLFGEVVDLYPEERWISIPARYFGASTRLKMGDVRAGENGLDEVIEQGGNDTNPCLGYAIYERACRYRDVGNEASALELFKKLDPFKEIIYWTWSNANGESAAYASFLGDMEGLDAALKARNDERDPKKKLARQIEIVNGHAGWYLNGMRYAWVQPLKRFHDKFPKQSDRQKAIDKFSRFMSSWAMAQKPLFAEAGRPFEADCLSFRIKAMTAKPDEVRKDVGGIAAGIKAEKNEKTRGSLAWGCGMTLAYRQQWDAALQFPELMPSPLGAAKLRYEINREKEDWKAAILAIEEIMSREVEPSEVQKWKYTLGWIYRDRTKEYEKAIKTYAEITDPPRQLWEISTAYRYAKKNKEAYRALTEIASMFPKDAADAVYRIAEWREQDGEKQKAIALYRRLLTQPEWKQSGASSRAHQALERLGIATGGAMTNTVR